MDTKVSIVKGVKNPDEKEIRVMVEKAIDLIGGIDDIISKGNRVLIKPNVSYELPDKRHTEKSDPRIAKAIYDIIVDMGARPVIGEASAAGVDGDAALKSAGYYDLRDRGYEVVNLKAKGGPKAVTIDNPGAEVLKKVKVFPLVKEADVIINLPVIKTHDHLPATLALKNMKGVMPDSEKKNFHKKYGLNLAIADLNLAVRPQLTIVDGIFCREGLGYPWSEEVEMDLILAGRDPVAVDTVTLLIMGFDPKEQRHAVAAEELGIGTMDMNKIGVVGETIENVKTRFKTSGEAVQELLKLQDFRFISSDTTCTGCRGTMYYFLKYLDDMGDLDKIKGYTFVMGEHESLPQGLDKEKTVLVGVCNEQYKDLGAYVEGCPPLSSAVMAVVFDTEIKQAYATDDE